MTRLLLLARDLRDGREHIQGSPQPPASTINVVTPRTVSRVRGSVYDHVLTTDAFDGLPTAVQLRMHENVLPFFATTCSECSRGIADEITYGREAVKGS